MTNKKSTKNDEFEIQLSEEDLKLKSNLELLAERVQDKDTEIQKQSLISIRDIIKTATGSMTSIPKPLKFLMPHYQTLKTHFATMTNKANEDLFADVLSCLAMTNSDPNARETLHFKMVSNIKEIGTWGHEYIKHLSGELAAEWEIRKEKKEQVKDLEELTHQLVRFNMKHNQEPDVCDLLLETEQLELIVPYCDENNYGRVCNYLIASSQFLPEPEDSQTLLIVYKIFTYMKKWAHSLRIAIKLNDMKLIEEVFESCKDNLEKKQLCFLMGRQLIAVETEDEELEEIMNNSKISEYFHTLIDDLELNEPRTVEEIYKLGDEERRQRLEKNVDSAKQNLATTFVNAFVHAGFGNDTIMVEDGNRWLHRNKEHGKMSAAASLGMILLWDVDDGLSQIDKFLYSKDDNIKAGALLSSGMINVGVRSECDPVMALISDYLDPDDDEDDEEEEENEGEKEKKNVTPKMKTGGAIALGMAYAGSAREDIFDLLSIVIEDPDLPIETVAQACLSLGMVYVGTGESQCTSLILKTFYELSEEALNDTNIRYMALGMGLINLGLQEKIEMTLEAVEAIPKPAGDYVAMTLETCAYAGTGNVLKIQKILHTIIKDLEREKIEVEKREEERKKQENEGTYEKESEENRKKRIEKKDKEREFLSVGVIGLALIGFSEEIGSEMMLRQMNHLLQYGLSPVRRAVPLALGLLCMSNPSILVIETLSRLSHDNDSAVAHAAILAMGLVGAGTTNARIGQLLRQLAQYYAKEPNHLFLVRISQGLLYLGKGTLALSPFYSDGFLLHRVAVGGIMAVLYSALDMKQTILGSLHYNLYWLVSAIFPKMLLTVDEKLERIKSSVRVGQAVDVVGQAGQPRTITGFQTHDSPVLLGFGERAELSVKEYIPLSPVLEGIVILKKNENFKNKNEKKKKK
ncbi:26s proteasome non-atpase regulatory subunit [Anaeramoeba flamelloides]|uniref:26s proteasome non-atpase regulatory subunit n=1 Tax=Anaeramoeba flamelloides TaxID=1746091 RepID=A0AAV7Z2J7_9EUKA|nr:26s proteasome non-atpase regulatory subunit [Anaeramoeba flamelloides]